MSDTLHAVLTTALLVYVLSALGNTMYAAYVAKRTHEHELTREGVYHVWVDYVKPQKATGLWGGAERTEAQRRVIAYVRRNSSCMCRCFSAPSPRILSWINEEVGRRKSRPTETTAFA